MMTNDISQTAKEVVRRNTIEVQGGGNWALFDELFDDNLTRSRGEWSLGVGAGQVSRAVSSLQGLRALPSP
jgi:hypothetical protein